MSWGKEVLVDCRGCNDSIKIRQDISDFIVDLCEQIDMIRVGEPVFVHIGDLGDKSGWTVFQMIRTSSVVAHFCDNGDAFFDIFSCKDIKAAVVQGVIIKWFSPKRIFDRTVIRGNWA